MSHVCRIDNCSRTFLSADLMSDHAEAVHTFGEIRGLVQNAIKEKYAQEATMATRGVYAWVEDLAADWVVFELSANGQDALFKSSYTVDANAQQVTLGDPQPVVRRVVYDVVSQPVAENEGTEGDDELDD